jgi:hypothetical protein
VIVYEFIYENDILDIRYLNTKKINKINKYFLILFLFRVVLDLKTTPISYSCFKPKSTLTGWSRFYQSDLNRFEPVLPKRLKLI